MNKAKQERPMAQLSPVGSDDILYRLRKEQIEREENLRLARANAYRYSTRD